MVVCAHIMVVSVLDGEPLINMGLSKLFSSSDLRSINPHSGEYVHTLLFCVVEGKSLINKGP